VETPAWLAWLRTISSFCYSSSQSSGRLAVRRDKRRRQTCWYGYAKNDGKLYNVYLGKTTQLIQANLGAACERLRVKARQEKRRE
jgi:LuxR family transcriptional regulator, maltose regulon positive regulatory protein